MDVILFSQVARRYEELLYNGEFLPFDQMEKNLNGNGGTIPNSMSDTDLCKNSRPSSANKAKGGPYLFFLISFTLLFLSVPVTVVLKYIFMWLV